MLLSHSGFPHVYEEAILPQRKDNQVQDLFLAQLSSARSKNLTILITTSGLVSNSLESLDYFELNFLCLCLYLSLGEQFMASNYCVTETMRSSSWSTGLIFGIEFESNRKHYDSLTEKQ